MDRRIGVVVIIVVLVTGASLAVLVNLETPLIIDVQWKVEVGDVLIFQLIVTGGNTTEWGSNVTAPAFAAFNHTSICAEIIMLPELPNQTDNESFLETVIFPIKFACTFENSSALPEPLRSRLTELLSWTLLPVGDWHTLNSMYNASDYMTDWYNDIWGYKICYTSMENETFDIMINHRKDWLHAYFERWQGTVDLETGLSTLATYSNVNICCTGGGHTVHLTLIPTH